ncbi:hypothetical protein [Streptomyces sp. NPDC001880]
MPKDRPGARRGAGAVRQLAKDFVAREIAPHVVEWDRAEIWPHRRSNGRLSTD